MPKRILFVDDDPLFLACCVPEISQHGYTVEELQDPRGAEERILRSPPSLLIVDEKMPWVFGHELIQSVRKTLSRLPCILITADARWVPDEFAKRFPIPIVVKDPTKTFVDRLLRAVRAEIGYAYEPTTRRRHDHSSGRFARVAQVLRGAVVGVAGMVR